MKKGSKLKELLQTWPSGTAFSVNYLRDRGYSLPIIYRYISSGWIKRLNRGLVAKSEDLVLWPGYVWALQQVAPFHVGGKTALEIQGKAHYMKFKETDVFLFAQAGFKFPSWLKSFLGVSFIKINTKLLPESVGIKEHSFGTFTLKISNPARAFLEYMMLVEKYHTFDEAYYIMENLHSISPHLMQEVLEQCTSLKVKRLVLCLAKKQNTHWFAKLDRSKIYIGTSVKQIVKNGAYDSEFLITYPHSWDKIHEHEVLF